MVSQTPHTDDSTEREFTHSEEGVPAQTSQENRPSSIEEAHIAALESELAQTRDQLLRTMAELENLRKRSAREREEATKYAAGAFARDILSVADNLRRAIEAAAPDMRASSLVQGVEATERELLRVFEKNGIRQLAPVGVPFDPNFHEVMFESPVPGKPDGTIFQLLEPGYVISDRLLRPARVGVVRNAPGTPPHAVDQEA